MVFYFCIASRAEYENAGTNLSSSSHLCELVPEHGVSIYSRGIVDHAGPPFDNPSCMDCTVRSSEMWVSTFA